jgi:hypothetical protein
MFGAGVYFAPTAESARLKSQHGTVVVIMVDVDLGVTLVLRKPDYAMNEMRCRMHGARSVKGCGGPGRPWEYAVYRPDQILNI